MEVAILTVGDEVLAGDIPNTNARWLATRLSDSGATVDRILTIPDDRDRIAATLRKWTDAVDATIVTGGLGGTHDDVTADALADAFDRELIVDEDVRRDVLETVAAYRDLDTETITADRLDFDVDAWSALPAGSRPLLNPEGLCPGCVLENVYAFPGVPAEMKALFERVAAEFSGDAVSRVAYTPQPEATVVEAVAGARERFDVTVGSYPDTERRNRLKVTGTDPETVDATIEWLAERIELDAEG